MPTTDDASPAPAAGEPQPEIGVHPEAGLESKTAAEQEATSRYFLVLFQSGDDDDPLAELNRRVVELVQQGLESVVKSPRSQTEIDIWLESPGGDANAAYKLFLELRSWSNKIRVAILDYAKSAATLLTIGADEIYMAAAAELGPLDAQIGHPDREVTRISALEQAHVLDFLGKYAADYILSAGSQLVKYTKLPRTVVLKEVSRFTALLLKPVVAKIDPQLTRQASNQLNIAHRYAEIMLSHRNLAAEDRDPRSSAAFLADYLVRKYPAHDFVISREEAASLGLPVRPAEGYDHWPEALFLYRSYRAGRELLRMDRTESFVQVFDQESITELLAALKQADGDDGSPGGSEDDSDGPEQGEGETPGPREGEAHDETEGASE